MFITKLIGDKRRFRHYRARIKQLPPVYRTTVDALERYLMHFGPGDGGSMMAMFDDLADLFEQSAASGTPVRAVVGEDPVAFAEDFLRNYPEGHWISREREKLTNAIDRITDHDPQ